jgi:hypothetical protein
MMKHPLNTAVNAVLAAALTSGLPLGAAHAQVAQAQSFEAPAVFQAAGTTIGSIEGTVDAYRAALDASGGINNGSSAGPLANGHREINWDGRDVVTDGPFFDGFLVSRGALFTTADGSAFIQATPAGLAVQFGNPAYESIFAAFSQPRLFSAIDGKITDVNFFVPGAGSIPATTIGFGAIFSDVDLPNGSGPGGKHGNRKASTLVEYYGLDGRLLYSSFVSASPGDAGFSFLGIAFDDARIASVRIISGNVAPGADDGGKQDIVTMDDFLYGEPQPLP